MSTSTAPRKWTARNSIVLAQTTCICLGAGMALWGMSPVLIERLVTGRAPETPLISVNGVMMLVGVIFIVLQYLFSQGRRWAMWSAFVLACLLAGAGVALVFAGHPRLASSFSVLLTGWTVFATWLGLGAMAQRHADSVEPSPEANAPTSPPASQS